MKPPRNPLAGTRGDEDGRRRPRLRRGVFAPVRRSRKRIDARLREPKQSKLVEDARALGVPVYDRNAQQAELGRYGVSSTPPRR